MNFEIPKVSEVYTLHKALCWDNNIQPNYSFYSNLNSIINNFFISNGLYPDNKEVTLYILGF